MTTRTAPFRAARFALAVAAFCAAVESADTAPVDALKQLTVEELMNVKVTVVSKQPDMLSKSPVSVAVITADEIRRSGATRLPEALRLAPNLTVLEVSSHEWAVSARGFNNLLANKLLVMIDGRSVYTPLFGGVFWDVQDVLLEDVDRIEVISGPGGAVWGANAVNGVVNVVTKSAQETQGGYLLAGMGNELRGLTGARHGGRLAPNLFYRVYGKLTSRDETVFRDGAGADDDWVIGQGGVRLDWKPSDRNLVTFQGDLYSGEISRLSEDETSVAGGNGMVRLTHWFSEESELAMQFYYDRSHRRIPNTFGEALDTYDLDAHHRFPIGERQTVTWGLGYRLLVDDVDNSETLAFLPPEQTQHLLSGFVQDQIALVPDRLTLFLGAKLERRHYTGLEFQPSVRLSWAATERQTVWAGVSRAVRAPSRIDRDYYVPGEPPYSSVMGDSDFDSETLVAYELGYRLQPNPAWSFSIASFFHDYDDLRSLEPISPPARSPAQVANGFEGQSYGAETWVHYQPIDWWRLMAGYTHTRVDVWAKPHSLDPTEGAAESRDPKHNFSVRSGWDLPGRVELDAILRYVSGISNQDLPDYVALDMRLGWRADENLEFSVVGRNLMDDRHSEFGGPAARREIERSVFGQVTWRF